MGRYKLETGMKKMQFLARVNDGGTSATDREAQRPSEQKLKLIVIASGQKGRLVFEREGLAVGQSFRRDITTGARGERVRYWCGTSSARLPN
jgi:hypothetical protein